MSYSPILLGTPNNNDGDSLYVGGVKINNNFTELYNALAGSTSNALLINFQGAGIAGKGNILRWNTSTGRYASASSDTLKTNGSSGVSALFITNRLGVAGAEDEFSGKVDSLYAQLNGRLMFGLTIRNTSDSVVTRGELNFGLGQTQVTSMSVYTTSVVVRGLQGLQVYAASAEDVSSYTRLLITTGSGIVLEETPALSGLAIRAVTDSSNSIAHTGLVQASIANNVSKYTLSATTITAGQGLLGGGDFTTNRTIYLDPRLWPEHIDGFLYDLEIANNIRVAPGSAVHYSFSTTGATRISETSALAFVSTSASMIRTWTTGWTTTVGGPAIIDSIPGGNGPRLATWYYLFLVGNATNNSVDFVVSANRDMATVSSLLFTTTLNSSVQVVRRFGAVFTDVATTGNLLRFNTQSVGGNIIRQNWLATNGALMLGADTSAGVAAAIGDTRLLTAVGTRTTTTSAMNIIGSATTITAYNEFSGAVLTQIPPIPGVTARLNVVHNPSSSLPVLAIYGEGYFSSSTAAARSPTFQLVRSAVTSVLNYHSLVVPMVPDNSVISDSQIATITTSTGARIRQLFIAPGNNRFTSNSLHYLCEGFDLAR